MTVSSVPRKQVWAGDREIDPDAKIVICSQPGGEGKEIGNFRTLYGSLANYRLSTKALECQVAELEARADKRDKDVDHSAVVLDGEVKKRKEAEADASRQKARVSQLEKKLADAQVAHEARFKELEVLWTARVEDEAKVRRKTDDILRQERFDFESKTAKLESRVIKAKRELSEVNARHCLREAELESMAANTAVALDYTLSKQETTEAGPLWKTKYETLESSYESLETKHNRLFDVHQELLKRLDNAEDIVIERGPSESVVDSRVTNLESSVLSLSGHVGDATSRLTALQSTLARLVALVDPLGVMGLVPPKLGEVV